MAAGDVLRGEITLAGQAYSLRLLAHREEERYHERATDELVPLSSTTGVRTYVQVRPYVLEPEITLTIGVYEQQRASGAIGEVLDSTWQGMRHRDIGRAQAWYYPADELVVLWECYLHERERRGSIPSAIAPCRPSGRALRASYGSSSRPRADSSPRAGSRFTSRRRSGKRFCRSTGMNPSASGLTRKSLD